MENPDLTVDLNDLTETMAGYLEKPLNLNVATREQLQQIIFLNDYQISKLSEYLYSYGQILTLYELQAIEGWTRETIERLIPFVTVAPVAAKTPLKFRHIFSYGKNVLFIRTSRVLEQQAGYRPHGDSLKLLKPNSFYLGSPYQFYIRYSFNFSDRVKLGLVADKDAGEEFFKGTQPNGFDLYSVYLQLKNPGVLNNLVIGDFQAQFGQGLTLWKGMTFGKSPEAVLTKKAPATFKPNTSANSSNFFRGTAISLKIAGWNLSSFLSEINRDGNISPADTITEQDDILTSLVVGGYHRTNSEMEKKNAVNEKVYGSNLTYSGNNFSMGVSGVIMTLGMPLEKSPRIYNRFTFTGKSNYCFGFDYTWLFSKYLIFGEVSTSRNGGMAWLSGLNAWLHPAFQLSIVYRNYGKDYHNLLSNAFGENSGNTNERGFYSGISIKPASKLSLSAYADIFSFDWIKTSADQPSRGYEYSVLAGYTLSKTAGLSVRYRLRNKQENIPGPVNANYVTEYSRENFRLNIDYQILPLLQGSTRIEFSITRKLQNERKGFLAFQDFDYVFLTFPVACSFRFCIFDTDSYDERIYAYENDVLYAFSAPSFFYEGIRSYFIIKYNPFPNLDFWIKLSRTSFLNQAVSGSGLDLIEGPDKTELKVQLRFKL